jgi:hypothetical protein
MIVIGVDPHSGYIPRPWLVARNERVDDVPSTATAQVRQLSRGGRRKERRHRRSGGGMRRGHAR